MAFSLLFIWCYAMEWLLKITGIEYVVEINVDQGDNIYFIRVKNSHIKQVWNKVDYIYSMLPHVCG